MASKNDEIIESIEKFYEVKLMGDFYLGKAKEKDDDGIYLSHQKNYIKKLLKPLQLVNAKDSKIPSDTGYYRSMESASEPITVIE